MTRVVSVWGRSKNLNLSPSIPTLLAQVWDNLAGFVWIQGLHWPLAEALLGHQLKSSVGEAVLSAWLFTALFLSPDPDSRESQRLDLFVAFILVPCVRLFAFSMCNSSHAYLADQEGNQGAHCLQDELEAYPVWGWNHRWSQGGWSSKFKLSASLSTICETLHQLV